MLKHSDAAEVNLISLEASTNQEKIQCGKCDYKTETLRCLNLHISHKHKQLENLRSDLYDTSFELSDVEEERKLSFSLENNTSTLEEPNLEFQISAESECGLCNFIGSSRTDIEEHTVQNHS